MDSLDPTNNDDKKVKKKKKEGSNKDEKKEIYSKALQALKSGQFPNPNSCAVHFGVCAKTLSNLFKENREYVGGGRQTVIFTAEEENKLTDYVSERMSLWCRLDFHQICTTIQELIGILRVANPDRKFSTDWDSDFPEESYVRRFMKRHKLVLRRTMALSNARAMLTPADLDNWSNMFPAALVPPCLPQEVRAPQRLQSCWQRLSPAQPKRFLLPTRFSSSNQLSSRC